MSEERRYVLDQVLARWSTAKRTASQSYRPPCSEDGWRFSSCAHRCGHPWKTRIYLERWKASQFSPATEDVSAEKERRERLRRFMLQWSHSSIMGGCGGARRVGETIHGTYVVIWLYVLARVCGGLRNKENEGQAMMKIADVIPVTSLPVTVITISISLAGKDVPSGCCVARSELHI